MAKKNKVNTSKGLEIFDRFNRIKKRIECYKKWEVASKKMGKIDKKILNKPFGIDS